MMVGYIVTIGVIVLMAVVGIAIAWHRGYAAGHEDGRADENCKMAQAAYAIRKELAAVTEWSPRDSLHDMTDLED